MTEYSGPLPAVTSLNRPYWEGLRRHELRIPRCDACGAFWLPPGPWCPTCWSRSFTWAAASGRAKVSSWVRFHQRYFRDGAFEVPYAVAEVALAVGPRLYADIVGGAPVAGLDVEVSYDDVSDDLTLARFRPVATADPREPAAVSRTERQ